MKSIRIIAMAIVATVMSVTAATSTGFIDGNTLYQSCISSVGGTYFLRSCRSYVLGVADGMLDNELDGYTACLPAHVQISQVEDVVTRFLAQHPERRHLRANSLVARAISESFPCR